MSTMAEQERSADSQQYCLEDIQLEFLGKKPKTPLTLRIAGDELKTSNINDPYRWKGHLACSSSTTLEVQARKKWVPSLPLQRTIAAVKTRVSDLRDIERDIRITDSNNSVNIILGFKKTCTENRNTRSDEAPHPGQSPNAQLAPFNQAQEDVSRARGAVATQDVLLDKLGSMRALVERMIGILGVASVIHPAAGAAIGAINFLYETCERQEEYRNAARELTGEFDRFLDIRPYVPRLEEKDESRDAVKEMLELISSMSESICSNASAGITSFVGQDRTRALDELKAKFHEAADRFDRSMTIAIVMYTGTTEENDQLKKLKHAGSRPRSKNHQCLPGTRKDLKGRIYGWTKDRNRKIFWLCGMAGSGKSSVANTIAEELELKSSEFYVSCFFCKRDSPGSSKAEYVLPSLSFLFANHHPTYKEAILHFLRKTPNLEEFNDDLDTQFKQLFEEPLKRTMIPNKTHIVIIDALDECGAREEQSSLAKCIVSLANSAPWIKVFVTSRKESVIREVFDVNKCEQADIYEEKTTKDDIRLFIKEKFNTLNMPPLTDNNINELVEQAAGLFIWCSTLHKYLQASLDVWRDLKPFLRGIPPKEPLTQLYELYKEIIGASVQDGHAADSALMHATLGIIAVTASNRPISAKTISYFLKNDTNMIMENKDSVRNIVSRLHAVLYEDTSMREAVRVYHPSFLDFLQEKLEDGPTASTKRMHRLVFKGCVEKMKAELIFNICGLQDSSLLNKDVLGLIASDQISEGLHYGSLYWLSHLSQSGLEPDADEAISAVSALLQTRKVLFWLEVLSLHNDVGHGISILRECSRFFENSKEMRSKEITAAAIDLERLVSSYSEAMESVPHIYLSALSWAPNESWTQKHLAPFFNHLPLITHKDKRWERAIWMKDAGKTVYCVAHSSNRRYIAAGLGGNTIRIWDARTGATFGAPLEGHTDDVLAVTFSPDSRFIASGSSDGTIRIWNVQSGEPVERLEGHSNAVSSLAFSPVDQYLVSGSHDKTVRLWDILTGRAVGKSLDGHSSAVRSVCFSPNGQFIASGSDDKTVRIWNALEHASVHILGSHSLPVTCVAFSSDGETLASASHDKTIRLWNVQSRTFGELLGHFSEVTSIAFSPDGERLVSGSHDATAQIWNVRTRKPYGEPLRGHLSVVFSVCFSPDGRCIVSGSEDKTMRIWAVGNGYTKEDLPGSKEDSQAVVAENVSNSESDHREHFNSCCLRMKIEDNGWVKDGEKLVLWIPYRHRKNFKHRLYESTDHSGQKTVKAEVNLDLLYTYIGPDHDWTRIMK